MITALCAAAGMPLAAAAQCGWEHFPAPVLGNSNHDLRDVAGVAGDDVWAVGSYRETDPGGFNPNHWTYAVHFDGAGWTVYPTPNPSQLRTWNRLENVVAVASDEVYAVGSYNPPSGPTQTLFIQWDGTDWERVPVPAIEGGSVFEGAVWVDEELWVVGNRAGIPGMGPSNIGLAGRYTGSGFEFEPVPSISGGGGRSFNQLRAVDGVASDDLWAVGWAQGATGVVVGWAYVVHRGPGGWEAETHIFGDPTVDSGFYDVVAVASDDVWAVGYTGGDAMIAHWNGSAWTEEDLTHLGLGRASLRGVTAVSPTEIYASGTNPDDVTGQHSPLVLRYDGSAWKEVKTAPPADGAHHQYFGIAASPGGDVWTVGNYVQFTSGDAPALAERLSCGETCRADLDDDGALTFFDFLAFQNLFTAGEPEADFTSDGVLDFFDFLAFQNEFAAGCP